MLGQDTRDHATMQFGDRCFATAGPTLWNSLPEQLWQPETIVENVYVWLVGGRDALYVKLNVKGAE